MRGITVSRAFELAHSLVGSELTAVSETDITREQAYDAAEMMTFGTTMDVLPIVQYDGHTIGDGRPGPVFTKLLALLGEDQLTGKDILTPVRPA